ncbi:hypothetical protein PF005_g16558 [Phytophthora fragariae]|uniref:Uncharacterized protein n=1 Tax=Phytophthora fragariae TaxID=53985 RepID=A0A6A3E5J8_9STRA|nr:hypothetical protein PF003_g7629 [Phytophthora fragariae]KAE8926180.1 hypothetical protein PF009_g23624 [Phytophthora fragariae]KAE8982579.1 hypothetical protein PF011_g21556 [Phytophthora fragariae]KAE9099356.1 hypothetical protein PF007_g15909 [Phytophthora fragariae]KAE9099518.1 hypothetical protein PF010_g15167 [Phytophthora fragariae]
MWGVGGIPGKILIVGLTSTGLTCEEVGQLCRCSKFKYNTRIRSTFTLGRLDMTAYMNIPTSLVLTRAHNPTCKKIREPTMTWHSPGYAWM